MRGGAAASAFAALLALHASADVTLTVTAREPAPAAAVPVTSGFPFAAGALTDPARVRLLRGGAEVPLQVLKTATWPDGSVRWLLLDFQTDLPAAPGAVELTLQTGTSAAAVTGIVVTEDAATLAVDTGSARFALRKDELLPRGLPFEVVSEGRTYRAAPSAWTIEERGAMKVVVRVDGSLRDASGRLGGDLVGFRARLTFYRDKAWFRAALTFRNNGALCWAAEGCTRQPDVVLSGATFGAALLPPGGRYVFGPGVERTWRALVPAEGAPALEESRWAADGSLAPGYVPPPPLAVAPASVHAQSGAWGRIALPPTGLPADRQADFDRFEKLQRAKVIAADVEDPPGLSGITLFGHLAQDLGSWNDYGDLRWAGNGCGVFSGNHYDWSYGMYLHFLRTGRLPFADAARVFARHEVDLDVYHTLADGAAFNRQKNWEDRPSHETPDNCFGGGRPTHTWSQGYALHWLLTGDPRGRDGFEEIEDGVRQYLYESFNGAGRVDTSEIRTQGWITENLVNLWRVNPSATLATTAYGTRTIPQAMKDVLASVFDREAAAGGQGFVFDSEPGGDVPDPNLRAPLQHLYFIEPAIKAYVEVFAGRDPEYAARLLGLIRRMTDYLISVTYGGDVNAAGLYRPRQIPFRYDVRTPIDAQGQGQVVYDLMAANAASFVFLATGEERYRTYARAAFSDYVRYFALVPGDAYADPALRSPTAYNTALFSDTESKIQGWSSRYGQYLLAAEGAGAAALAASFTFEPQAPAAGESVRFTDTSTGSPASWSWTFGDGFSSTERSPAHAYASAGTFEAVLTVARSGATSTARRTVVVSAGPAGSTATLFVPAVLSLAGRAGSFFTSELVLTNRGASPAALSLAYTAFSGGGSGAAANAGTLAAGRQLVVPDAIAWLRGKGIPIPASGNLGGTLRVTFAGLGSAADAAVTVRTTTPVPPAAPTGRAGLAYAGLPAGGLLSSPVLVCGLRSTEADRSAIALQNAGGPGDGDVVLRITYLPGAGSGPSPFATLDVTLSPGGFAQPPLPDPGEAAPSFYARVERVSGSAPWYAYGVVNDNGTSDGSFVAPIAADAAAAALTLPVAVDAPPFSTELIVTNVSAQARQVLLTWAASGIPGGSTSATLALAAGEQRIVPDFAAWLRASGAPGMDAAPAPLTGPLFVSGATAGLAVSARTGNPASDGSGRYGLFYAAVPSALAGDAWLYGLRQDDSSRTNLALATTGAASVFAIDLFSGESGLPLGTLVQPVGARGFVQLGRVLTLVPGGAANGYARVRRTSGSDPFLAYAVVNDGARPGERSGDGAFLAAVPE